MSDERTVPIEQVLGEDWELPEGFHWEYRDGEDGGGSIWTGSDGVQRSQTILGTKLRRAVGPWAVCRERKVLEHETRRM